MKRRCPLCKKKGLFVFPDHDITWNTQGGGIIVCRKCGKTRLKEIQTHNNIYCSPEGHRKDTGCRHEWLNPYPGRYYCPKCTAEFNWTCGCGGSNFVCLDHNNLFWEEKHNRNEYLAANSW